jgi:hypothetical protein
LEGKVSFSVFLTVATLFQCLSHGAVTLSLVKIIYCKYILSIMARRRHIRDEDFESKLICDTDLDEYLEDRVRRGGR